MSKGNQQPENDQSPNKKRHQIYDASFKGLFEQQAHLLIPHLIEGAEYVETLDIEIIQLPMRADRVQKILYDGQPSIFDFEFQVGRDVNLPARLLMYCSKLYYAYQLPVISVVIYPFPTLIAKSPLRVMSGEKEILKLDFRTLPLFEEDATKYVEASAICMYSLLPTMKHVNATLIRHACAEMKTYYYERDEDSIFRDNIIWMKVFLDGPNKIPLEEKQKIKEALVMHGLDRLWEEDPDVRQTFAAGEAKGKAEGIVEGLAEGKIEGQLEGLRTSVEMVTNARFPSLTDLARQKVVTIRQAETLSMLLQQIITAPNEETVLWLLLPQKPS